MEDVIIEPGKTLALTREFSKFSLNNKKSKVELRYPDGKVAHDFAYNKKKESVKEDEIYTKESGQWAWVAPKAEIKLALAAKPAETMTPVPGEKELPKEPEIILASAHNFSEDENLLKNASEKFSRPQGIVLGAATFKPAVSRTYLVRNNASFLEIIFTQVNPIFNYFINNFFLKLGL